MEQDGDQIFVSSANNSVTIDGTLDTTLSPSIVWVSDAPGKDVDITITNSGLFGNFSSSFGVGGDAALIYGKLTFNNEEGGELHGEMQFSNLTKAATVSIVNNGMMTSATGDEAIRLSTDGASFSIVNGANGVIGGDGTAHGLSGSGTGVGIVNASNTLVDNYGVIYAAFQIYIFQPQSDSSPPTVGTAFNGQAIKLEEGTNDVINNHAGGSIEGGTLGIGGNNGGVTINNEAGALIDAFGGTAISFSIDANNSATTNDLITINNAGEIIGNARISSPNSIAADTEQQTGSLVVPPAAGAIGTSGHLQLVNSGLITDASAVQQGVDADFTAAIIADGGRIGNRGAIIGANIAIEASSNLGMKSATTVSGLGIPDADAAISIRNHGFIQGGAGGAIVLVGTEDDTLRNSGHIVGDVRMGAGHDVVRLTGSSTIDGNIMLGGGNDVFKGSAADEDIYGGKGSDRMTGGGGDDTFHFARGYADPGKANVDVITDFTPGADKLDLSAIDANGNVDGNDKFTFIGTDPFSGHAGELRYEQMANRTAILGDIDGDGKEDFRIDLHGLLTLTAHDFAL